MTLLEQVKKHYSQTPVSAMGVLAEALTPEEYQRYLHRSMEIGKQHDLQTAREHDQNA